MKDCVMNSTEFALSISKSEEIEVNFDYNKKNIFNYENVKILRYCNTGLNYSVFYENFIIKNHPCVIENICRSWKCMHDWIVNENINTNFFREKYGNLIVTVANCNSTTNNSQCTMDMKVSEYMNYMESHKLDLYYLKDWHLKKSLPNETFYEVPKFFSSDWLNEYAMDLNEDDFMFVYIGPQKTWTPIHADVYSSYSWSVNVVGRKRWIFFPPGEENKLTDSLGNLPLRVKPEELKDVVYFDVVQEQGEAIFVPSGWHHQVENLLDTISINHNWVNGGNINLVWKALQKSLDEVKKEIQEFKDTPEYVSQCQLILKSLFGMNYEGFLKLLIYIGKKRLLQLNGEIYLSFEKYLLGKNHIKYDLKMVLYVMEYIVIDNVIEKYNLTHMKDQFETIFEKLKTRF